MVTIPSWNLMQSLLIKPKLRMGQFNMRQNNLTLSPQELDAFNQKGYVGPFTFCSPEEMKKLLDKIRLKLINTKTAIYNEPNKYNTNHKSTLLSYDRHLDIAELAKLIASPIIVRRLQAILGENIICWRTELFPKYPGDEGTDWHQSSTFKAVDGYKKPQIEWPVNSRHGGALTVWIALTHADEDNGCLQFIPGTHKQLAFDENKVMQFDLKQINQVEKNGVRKGFFGYDYRQLQVDPSWRPDESKAESMVMRPGQFIIFWSTLLHASHEHKGLTKEMRLGFSARYVPTNVRIYPYSDKLNEFGGQASLARHKNILVCGTDKYHYNENVTLDEIYSL